MSRYFGFVKLFQSSGALFPFLFLYYGFANLSDLSRFYSAFSFLSECLRRVVIIMLKIFGSPAKSGGLRKKFAQSVKEEL